MSTRGRRGRWWRRVAATALVATAVTLVPGGPPDGAAAQAPGTTTTTTRPESWQGAGALATTWQVAPDLEATAIATDGDVVVAAADDGRFAAYGTDGVRRWTSRADPPGAELAAVHGLHPLGDVMVAVADDATGAAAHVVAVEPSTGAVAWSDERGRFTSTDRIVTDGETLVVATRAGELTAYDATGATVWERSLDERLSLAGQIDGIAFGIVGASPAGRVLGLSLADGTTVWESDEIGAAEMQVGERTVVATARDLDEVPIDNWLNRAAVVSFDPTTGEQRWAIETSQAYNLAGWEVLGDQLIAVRATDANAYDTTSAAVAWSIGPPDVVPRASALSAPPLVAGDRVLLAAGRRPQPSDPGTGAVVEVSPTGTVTSVLSFEGQPVALTPVGDDVAVTVDTVDGLGLLAFTPTSALAPDEPDEPDEETTVLLGIPSPEDALTVKNAGLAGALLMLLLVLVVVPSTLFNKALADRLPDLTEHRRNPFERRWIDRGTGTPLRHRWRGLAIYLAVSAAVYSLLEPNWGLNWATAVTTVAFGVALTVTTVVEFASRRFVLRRRFGRSDGHPELWFPSLGIAALCVAGSRAIAFVPGYVYGVVAEYHGAELSDEDEGRFHLYAAVTMLVLSVAAWFAAAGLGGFGTTGIGQLPGAIAAGIFMAGVETLTVGLLPVALLPGAVLRAQHRHWWKVLWATSAFLFCLAMLRPGLVSAQSGSTRWLLAGAAVYGGAAVLYWWVVQRRHGAMVPFPEPSPPAEPTAGEVGVPGRDP